MKFSADISLMLKPVIDVFVNCAIPDISGKLETGLFGTFELSKVNPVSCVFPTGVTGGKIT